MADIEREATFYLGREVDPSDDAIARDRPIMYDARDLTTHAVCIGMTGSGKTGLCIDLLEEATLDGVPSIIIDPKGDMTNLLLTFPDLKPDDFRPWVNADDARRKGVTEAEYAASMAALWQKGLADWDQDGERIRRLKEAAEFTIYTPGSDAGIPVSILQSFKAPDLDWDDQEELLREQISGTVSALLGLAGIEADPIRSREHILLSNILENAWRQNKDLDLASIIGAIQRPPMERLGVLDLDVFYPEGDRFELAMRLNAVIAAPSFENWLEGPPLDVAKLLRTPLGKPGVSIFYIAHLSDTERMFFVTLLLEQVLSWMRRGEGTTSLRALVYFDEVFGYFPPYPKNPPSKRPLLSLLKTARAFGVGMVLTTQNPVDLDYKGLTNAGTWFVGKLQTDRDKARLLEGMDGVVSESGTMLDKQYLDRLISSLSSRQFILHNVHERQPRLFYTRWAMSYLRGPLTRRQVRTLMAPVKQAWNEAPGVAGATERISEDKRGAASSEKASRASVPEGYMPVQPRVNARVGQYFIAIDVPQQRAEQDFLARQSHAEIQATHLVYEPYLVGLANVLYSDSKRTRTKEEGVSALLPLPSANSFVDWDAGITKALGKRDIQTVPAVEAHYAVLPEGMEDSPPYTQLRDSFVDHIYRQQSIPMWVHQQLGLQSEIGEPEREFRVRCQEAARSKRDEALETAKLKSEREIAKLQERVERERRELRQDEIEFDGRKREEFLSAAESVISLFSGRKRSSGLSTASRKRRMTQQAKIDITESEETIQRLEEQIKDLQAQMQTAQEKIAADWSEVALVVEEGALRPKKTDIRLELFGLAWAPHWLLTWRDVQGNLLDERVAAWKSED